MMATIMATMAEMAGAADTKKGIKETAEKEKKEEKEELYRKEKEEREELYRKEEREELYRILSVILQRQNESYQTIPHSSNSRGKSEINISTVTTADEKECGVTGEPQGNTVRQKFRKFGLKKMERNMKEGKYTGKIKKLTVPGNENKNKMMTTIVEYDEEEDSETEAP